jgi:hypothetical protein
LEEIAPIGIGRLGKTKTKAKAAVKKGRKAHPYKAPKNKQLRKSKRQGKKRG